MRKTAIVVPISSGVAHGHLRTQTITPLDALQTKRFAKSRRISSKPAYIPVAAAFGRCGRARGLFGDMYCGTPGVDAPGLI